MTLSDITTSVRYLINDVAVTVTDYFTYENSSIFTLTESNSIAVTYVYINDSVQSSSSYSFSATTNQVTISSSLTSGDTIKIVYTCYENYSDTEIESYIRNALIQLSVYKYYTFKEVEEEIFPEPTDDEKNIIALITSILINPENKSYDLPDLKIKVPDDVPTNEKIRKTIASFKKDSHGVFLIE